MIIKILLSLLLAAILDVMIMFLWAEYIEYKHRKNDNDKDCEV